MSETKTAWVGRWMASNRGKSYAQGEKMTHAVWSHVFDYVDSQGLDPALVDPSLTYSEIMGELGKHSFAREWTRADSDNINDPVYLEFLNSSKVDTSPDSPDTMNARRVRAVCPVCGQLGSGPYVKRTSNGRGRIYRKYLYFAHRTADGIKWCYVGSTATKLAQNE